METLQHALNAKVKHAVTHADDNAAMSKGERIKLRRIERNMSVIALAKAVKVSKSAVYQWENGDTKTLKAATVVAIAEALNTYEKWIETGHGPKDRGSLVALEPDEAALLLAYSKLKPDTKKAVYAIAVQLATAEKKESNQKGE